MIGERFMIGALWMIGTATARAGGLGFSFDLMPPPDMDLSQ
jgi:hypothetical protein